MTLDGILGASDTLTHAFLTETYPAIAHAVEWPIYWLLVIYWCLLGYKVYAGHAPMDGKSLLAKTFMTVMVFSTLNWGGLGSQIYYAFTNVMESTAATIMAGKPTGTMLDALWNNVGQISAKLQEVNSYQIGVILLGYFMFAMNCWLFVLALAYMMVAKFGLAIAMVLLPLFIGFLVFEQTRQWFVNWVSKMLNFTLIYILVIAIVRFGFIAFASTLADAAKATTLTAQAMTIPLIAELYILEGVLILFLLQVKGWAAQLSGGATVQGLSALSTAARLAKGIQSK